MLRIIILLALLNLSEAQAFGLTDVLSIIDFVKNVYNAYNEIKTDVKTWHDVAISTVAVLQTVAERQESTMQKLENKLNSLSQQVENLHRTVDNRLNRLDTLLNRLPSEIERNNLKHDIAKSVRFVNKQHERFRQYTSRSYNNLTLNSFATSVTDQDTDGVESRLDEIFHLVVPSVGSPVGSTILGAVTEKEPQTDNCVHTRPTQQSLFDLYNTLVSTELLGFVVISYAYSLQTLFYNVSVNQEMKTAQHSVLDRVNRYHSAFVDTIRSLPRSLPACESVKKHIQDETYVELTGLFQVVVTVDYNLNKMHSCWGKCEDIGQIRSDDCYIQDGGGEKLVKAQKLEDCPNPKPCTGRLRDCITLSDTQTGGTRRYEWFTDVENNEYGPAHGRVCRGGVRLLKSWRKGWKFRHCEYCACICDNTDVLSRDRHVISFLKARSDTEKNKIVTGCRFTRKGRVLHVQIKQGVLEENGYVNRTSDEWLPVEDLKNYVETVQAKEGCNQSWMQFGEGKYFTAISSDNNKIQLDDVVLPFGRCVTGLQFGSSRGGIAIFVESSEFDYTTGKLVRGSNQWTSSSADKTLELSLGDADNPLLASGPNIQDSGGNHFVKFTMSSLRKDAGQSVVPYLDAGKVEVNPSAPLGGVGLYHKGVEGYGGFLALKMYSLDYAQLLTRGNAKTHSTVENKES